jgi:endonuclease-3
MARESFLNKQARVKKVIARLREAYPEVECELDHEDALQLLVATILSAQCTDKRVNMVTPALFRRYRSAADFANAKPSELEELIRTTGFFRSKARNIQAACRAIVEEHGGEVPRTMEELIQLGGVGRKTANVVLGNAFGINVGVVVDTHVGRLSVRLGMTGHRDPHKVEQDLMKLVPQNEWADFSHLLIWHGRRRCYARKPDCVNCEVLKLCPQIGVTEVKETKAAMVK